MGLFGGFKAKFTGNHGANSEKKKKVEVVCLKYHEKSEFDVQQTFIALKPEIKEKEIIKEKSLTISTKRTTSILKKNEYFTNENDNKSATKQTPPPPPPRNHDNNKQPQNTKTALTREQTTQNGNVGNETRVTPNGFETAKFNEKNAQMDMDGDHDTSTLIFMTQTHVNDEENSKSVTSNDFTINFVKYDDKHLETDYSEDETSVDEDTYARFNGLDFSSQAASIFFGGDLEPEPVTQGFRLTGESARRDSVDC